MEITVHLLTPKQSWTNGISKDRETKRKQQLKVSVLLFCAGCILLEPLFVLLVAESGSNRGAENTAPADNQTVEKFLHMNNGTKMDFSSSIRAEVAKENKDHPVGLEVRNSYLP